MYVVSFFCVVNSVFQDGTIDKNDLRGAFDNVGVLMTESELDELLGEVRKNNIHILLRQYFSRCQGLAPMTTWSSSSKTKWLGVSSYSILQVASHKPRNLFVKLIVDFNPHLKKPFSFLALASSKVQRFDGLHFLTGGSIF